MRAYPSEFVDALLAATLARLLRRPGPWLVGLGGAQGSGKSTLAAQLAARATAAGIPSVVVALDDWYLNRRERAALARTRHPLFATRGPPGTHAIAQLDATLRALRAGRIPLRVPRFDKGRDTRLAPGRARRIVSAPRLIWLEGWCVGVPPQPTSALARPCNALEREHDRDGAWRGAVNAALARDYAPVWRQLDLLLVLQAPDWPAILRWRAQAERALRRAGAPRAMRPRALATFMQHFERLGRHARRVLAAQADLLVELDRRRVPRRIRWR